MYFHYNSNKLIYCVIQNLGIEPAKNIRVHFDPIPLNDEGKPITDFTLFKEPLSYLPPNEKYWRQLGFSPNVIKQNPNPIRITVGYESLSGRKYSEEITMDLSVLKDVNYPAASIQDELRDVSKTLDEISKILQAKGGLKHIIHDR